MFVVIAGGDPTGAQLASALLAQGHRVCVVEHRREVLARLHRLLPTESIYEGHALDLDVLDRVRLRQAQVLAACLPLDAENLVLCYIARTAYHVPRTIARINHPHTAWLFGRSFGVDIAVNQAEIMAGLIAEEMSLGEMVTLLKLRRGRFALVEQRLAEGSEAAGAAIKDLPLPDQCLLAAIIRRGEMILPRGTTVLQPGDDVLAIVDPERADRLAALFRKPEAPA